MLVNIFVALHGSLNFTNTVNGPKLSVILLFERKVAGVAGRKANFLGDVRTLKSRRTLRGFSHHIDVSQLLRGPAQIFTVPKITR